MNSTTTSKTTKHVQQFLKTKISTFSSTPKTLKNCIFDLYNKKEANIN